MLVSPSILFGVHSKLVSDIVSLCKTTGTHLAKSKTGRYRFYMRKLCNEEGQEVVKVKRNLRTRFHYYYHLYTKIKSIFTHSSIGLTFPFNNFIAFTLSFFPSKIFTFQRLKQIERVRYAVTSHEANEARILIKVIV